MSAVIDNERIRKLLASRPSDAVEILYDEYGKSLLRYAFKVTRDVHVARDIVQETFLYIHENSRRLSKFHQQSFAHYLIRIVRFKTIDYFRRVRHVDIDSLLFPEEDGTLGISHTIEKVLIEKEFSQEIRNVIETFPKREKECLLYMIDGLKPEQIAARSGVTVKAIQRAITSGKKRLRKWAVQLGREYR